MVDQVVKDQSPDDGRARHGKERLAAPLERPHAGHVFVLGFGEGLARGRDILVEEIEDLFSAGQFRQRVRGAPTGAISSDGCVSVTKSQLGRSVM